MKNYVKQVLALLGLTFLLLLSPLAASAQSTTELKAPVKDKDVSDVKQVGGSTVVIKGKPATGGPSTLALGSYGEGGSYLYSGKCNVFTLCAKGTSYTKVYDNAIYDPQLNSNFYRNGEPKGQSGNQRNVFGDRQDWDSDWKDGVPATWSINTNHKVFQAVLTTSVEVANANTAYSFYY